jgi:adenylate cyclase
MQSPVVLELDLIRVKGRAKPTRIFTLIDAIDAGAAEKQRLVEPHARMLACYRGQDWDGAEAGVSACRAVGIAGLETLYRLYAARIAAFREAPPPADWDGADTATTK